MLSKTSFLEKSFEAGASVHVGSLGFELEGRLDVDSNSIEILLAVALPNIILTRSLGASSSSAQHSAATLDNVCESEVSQTHPKQLEELEMVEKGKAIFMTYFGLEPNLKNLSLDKHHHPLRFQWQRKITRPGLTVDTSLITDSPWQVLRAVGIISAPPPAILAILNDDERLPDIDENLDHVEV